MFCHWCAVLVVFYCWFGRSVSGPPAPDGMPDAGEFARRRRERNWALAACLFALMRLFYALTVVRMGESIHRALGVQ